jgi:hypothetical protein
MVYVKNRYEPRKGGKEDITSKAENAIPRKPADNR